MIICQMSNTRPKVFHWFLFPLALVVYTAVTGQLGRMEPIVLALFNMFVTAAHVHYGICVVNICFSNFIAECRQKIATDAEDRERETNFSTLGVEGGG